MLMNIKFSGVKLFAISAASSSETGTTLRMNWGKAS